MTPRVRVGIVSRNRATILPRAIESALAQDYPHKEVVVVDDGSTDGTREMAARFPQVRWIFNVQPYGYMDARNRMMQEPGADYYASLDDDSWFLEPDALSLGVEVIQSGRAAAVGYDILDDRQRRKHQRTDPLPANTYIGCGHLLDLQAVRKAGFYCRMPGSYGGEEKDLSLRLLNDGHEVVVLPGVHVWHDKTMTARDVQGQHRSGVCNDLSSTFRRCPPGWMPWVMLKKILSHLAFAVSFASRGELSRDAFDRAVVRACGRWLFIQPALSGVRDVLKLLVSGQHSSEPVSKDAWRKFRQRTLHPAPLLPVGIGTGNPESNPSVTFPDMLLKPSVEPHGERVTAIVAAYNRPEQTVETIRRILACTPPPDELLVHVDGNQTACASRIRQSFPDLRILTASCHLGPGGSRNVLLKEASCPLVASFDDDSYPMDPDFFQRAAWLAEKFPAAAVFNGEVWLPGEVPRRAEPQGMWVSSFLGGASVQRRDAMLQTSGYVPLPVAYGMEEQDMGLLLTAQNKRILQTPWLRVFHNNDLRLHENPEVTSASVRNVALLAFLRYPLVAWPVGVIQVMSRLLWLVRHGRRAGLWAGLQSIPLSLWERREFRRAVSLSDLRRFFELRKSRMSFPLHDGLSDNPSITRKADCI